jgi:hypothetical protein
MGAAALSAFAPDSAGAALAPPVTATVSGPTTLIAIASFEALIVIELSRPCFRLQPTSTNAGFVDDEIITAQRPAC